MCTKKKRASEEKSTSSQLGFRVFQRFYELTVRSKNPKSFDDFIRSPYYIEFIKFSRYLIQLNPIYCDEFVDFIIRNGIKLNDWKMPYVYETYLEQLMKKEPVERALERTVIEMQNWAEENGTQFNKFFIDINSNEATYLIKAGRISPWVIYLAESAQDLFSKLNEEQLTLIENIVDPEPWRKVMVKKKNDVKYVRTILEQAGL